MDYLKEYRRFITSHYLSDGIRITIGIALPAIVLGFFGELQTGIAVALGAMCVSSTDIPGPIHHRKNGMLACLFSIIAVAGLTGLSSGSPTALGITITVFCFVFCMIGVFGARAISVGVAALLIMVLSIGRHFTYQQLLMYVACIGIGGLWYMLLSLLLYSIRPHKLTQQALGEYISNVARYLRVRGTFYSPEVNYDEVYSQMLEQQIVVEHNQNLVSELLFKSRSISKDSTPTGRILMMIFLDMTDLYERTMMAVHDYRQLHQRFDNTGILQQFQTVINNIADELDETGLAVQSGIAARENEPLAASVQQLKEEFIKFRNERRTAENLEELIGLFHILQNIEDISTRLNTVKLYTSFDTRKIKPAEGRIGYKGIVNSQNISWQVLRDNLSIHSNIFRHALRVSIATLAGYIISRFLSVGHSYWILLTIIVILKPTYSLTRKRNAQRLWGTASGAVTGLI
ncbi:MAG: FUSC family protein, partial [Bacteroidetes bacterium]|nr:FUSC family protein [Bacteroidota bacterium]